MAILSVNTAVVTDMKKFSEYVALASSLMKKQGVEVLCRGKYLRSSRGLGLENHILAIFRYKDIESFDHFYSCAEYRQMIQVRDDACEMTIQIYSE